MCKRRKKKIKRKLLYSAKRSTQQAYGPNSKFVVTVISFMLFIARSIDLSKVIRSFYQSKQNKKTYFAKSQSVHVVTSINLP